MLRCYILLFLNQQLFDNLQSSQTLQLLLFLLESLLIEILKGIKKYYEDFHKVQISNDVIEKTVKMSEKYIHDRFLPDKAIDILDEACSKINLNNKELYELEILKNRLKEIEKEKQVVKWQRANTTKNSSKRKKKK